MVKIKYERYLLVNAFEKNENSILKYYRRYDVEKFDEYIERMKFTINKKTFNKKRPLYDFQKKTHQ